MYPIPNRYQGMTPDELAAQGWETACWSCGETEIKNEVCAACGTSNRPEDVPDGPHNA